MPDPKPTQTEIDVVKEVLAKSRVKSSQVNKMQDELRQAAKENYRLMADLNQKSAEKKRKENLDFGASLTLACIINEVKLFIHYEKLLEKMLESRDIKDTQAQQRYLEILRDDRNPFEVTLPQQNQSPAEYKEQILAEAEDFLANIISRKEELEHSIIANWGATNWNEGLKIQATTVHKAEAEKIDKLEFLDVIKKPDGSNFDPKQLNHTDFNPADIKKAKDAFNEVNDVLLERLNNIRPPVPEKPEDFKMIFGDVAPVAPPISSRAIIIGDDAPALAPSLSNSRFFATTPAVRITEREREDEVKFLNQFRKAWNVIRDPFVTKAEKAINDKDAVVDENSSIRLAVKSAANSMGLIKNVEAKAVKFIGQIQQLTHLNHQQVNAQDHILKIKAESRTFYQRPGNN